MPRRSFQHLITDMYFLSALIYETHQRATLHFPLGANIHDVSQSASVKTKIMLVFLSAEKENMGIQVSVWIMTKKNLQTYTNKLPLKLELMTDWYPQAYHITYHGYVHTSGLDVHFRHFAGIQFDLHDQLHCILNATYQNDVWVRLDWEFWATAHQMCSLFTNVSKHCTSQHQRYHIWLTVSSPTM